MSAAKYWFYEIRHPGRSQKRGTGTEKRGIGSEKRGIGTEKRVMPRFSVPMPRFWVPMPRFSVPVPRFWDPPGMFWVLYFEFTADIFWAACDLHVILPALDHTLKVWLGLVEQGPQDIGFKLDVQKGRKKERERGRERPASRRDIGIWLCHLKIWAFLHGQSSKFSGPKR